MKLVRFETLDGRIMPGEADVGTNTIFALSENGSREAVAQLSTTRLHAPCVPTKIVAVGVNYRAHAAEFGKPVPEEPLLFLKPPSAVIAPEGTIVLPRASQLVHHEAELALVIARYTRRVSAHAARDSVLGFTCFNDVTARDLQRKDVQFTRGKGFDTFAPVGPWIETDINPRDLGLMSLGIMENGNDIEGVSGEDRGIRHDQGPVKNPHAGADFSPAGTAEKPGETRRRPTAL